MGTALAALGGAALGAGAYAAEGAALSPVTSAAVLGGGGIVAGLAAGGLNKSVGAGIAGAGAALAALTLLRHFMETKPSAEQASSLRRLRGMRAVAGQLPDGRVVQMRAVQAQMPGGARITMR